MTRTIKIAAIQMVANPAPKSERLERAESLIAEAASSGAQLVVLPEVFNTGYEYHDNNYSLAEPIDGETVTWMKERAAEHNIHLAGSLLLLDGQDVYNSQILVAPDGRRWRYDKNYPFAFERAYFRDGHETMVAHTDLGKLGMMICWDYAHPELWQRYAGQVDALIVTSSPPTMLEFQAVMPDGHKVDSRSLGPLLNRGFTGKDEPFGANFDEQVKWLGVPAVNTTGSGVFQSHLPRPRIPIFFYLAFRPDLWRHVRKADEIEITASYYNQTKVLNAQGKVVSRLTDPEGFTIAEVELPEETPPASTENQPHLPFTTLSYFYTDVMVPALMERPYREGVRRQWGQRMAPFQRSIRWSIVIGLGLLGIIAAMIRFIGRLTSGGGKSQTDQS